MSSSLIRGLAAAALLVLPSAALAGAPRTPAPAAPLDTAVFAGGCFWGVEAVFEHVRGVVDVVSGYSGGDAKSANYDLVAGGRTQHAEAVRVVYDPAQVTYGDLLRVLFSVAHDPTQLDRQGPDVGPQYRSAIFASGPEQERAARAYVAQLEAAKFFPRPIVTQIVPLRAFYVAEAYHQDFAALHPTHPYIVHHDAPKVAALKKGLPALYRDARTASR